MTKRLDCPNCGSIFWETAGEAVVCMDCEHAWTPERPCVMNNVTGLVHSSAPETVKQAVTLCAALNMDAYRNGMGGLYGVGFSE